MKKIKEFASDYKYELAVAGVLLVKLICECRGAVPLGLLLIACQFGFVALLTARFIKSVDESNRHWAECFAAMFLVFFLAAYHYSLFSFAKVTAPEHISILLFFISLYCLSFDGLALACVPLAVAGVALDRTFTVTCLPVLIASAAFAGGSLFAKKSKKSNKQIKRERKNGKPSILLRLAAFDRFASPLLLVVLIASAVRYAFAYDKSLGFFYASGYYITYNYKYLFYFIPFIAVIGSLIYFVRKNRRAVCFLAALLCASAVTVASSYLFDFGLIHFKVFRLCAVFGAFAGIFAISARNEELGADMRRAACDFIKKAYPLVIIISLCAFCVVWELRIQ